MQQVIFGEFFELVMFCKAKLLYGHHSNTELVKVDLWLSKGMGALLYICFKFLETL